MNVTIFGATGNVGGHLVGQALEAGHRVTVFVRDASRVPRRAEVRIVEGTLSDVKAIAQAIDGADAVLSALGARQNTPDQVELFGTALAHITDAMKRHGVKRLVSISGAGVLVPGDKVELSRRIVRRLLLLVSKWVALAKEREWEVISRADLDWVVVRAPRIVDGPSTGTYRVFTDRVPSPKISRGDVADLMLRCATGDEYVRKAPIVGY